MNEEGCLLLNTQILVNRFARHYIASFQWSRDTPKITLGKIQLCDGQVHGNDVDEIGWSVFALAALLLKFCPFFVGHVLSNNQS